MDTIATIILPVSAIVALGWGLRRFDYLAETMVEGLSGFVFKVALPLLIFRTLAQAELPDVSPWTYWAAYFGGVALVWLGGGLVVRAAFGASMLGAVAAGMTASFSNTVMLGIPLIYTAYGEAGAVPLFLIISVHMPLLFLAGTVLAEASIGEHRQGPLALVAACARTLARNPIVLAILAGGAYGVSGLTIAPMAHSFLDMMATSAVPCALFAMGMELNRYGLAGQFRPALVLSALKLVVHPLIVYLLAFHVFTLPEVWAATAVIFAATPTGVNAFVFAARYGAGEHLASSTIALSTALSVVTVAFWLAFLTG